MNNDRWQWGLTLIFDMQYTPERSLHIHQHSGLDSDFLIGNFISLVLCEFECGVA
jgi:hypothetical protein